MPRWLRLTIVALYVGVCAGCGTNGLLWVDDKFSRLSTPPASAPNTALRDGTTTARAAAPSTPVWPNAARDPEDATVAAPSRFKVISKVRTIESDPPATTPIASNEARIPAAFAMATPKLPRPSEDTVGERESAAPKHEALDLPPEGKEAPVALVVHHKSDEQSKDSGPPLDPPLLPPAKAMEQKAIDEPKLIENTADAEVARAEPIPKATPLPPKSLPKKLKLSNVALCKGIQGFGRFTPTGAVAQGGWLLLYAEVSGRSTKATAEGMETHLRGKLRLTPKSGGPTNEWPCPDTVKREAAEQKDFFYFVKLHLPESLSEGDYRLEVVVEDVHGGAAASEELSLRVGPRAAAAN